jgi:hypothetical protein
MSERFSLPWLRETWKTSSLVSHAAGFDWALGDRDDGGWGAVHPRPALRATWLNHLVLLYLYVAQTYLAVIGVSLAYMGVEVISHEAMAIVSDRWLRQLTDGDPATPKQPG